MTDQALTLNDAQIDYLRELANIGTGSAAGTLSFMLRRSVRSEIPVVHIGRAGEIASSFGHHDTPLAGIRLALTGDIKGSLIFYMAEADQRRFVEMVRQRSGARKNEGELAIMILIAQAAAASHLDAIKRFCGLDIHQSKPVPVTNLSQTFKKRALPRGIEEHQALLVESVFVVAENQLKTYLLLLPDQESLPALVSSVDYVTQRIFAAS